MRMAKVQRVVEIPVQELSYVDLRMLPIGSLVFWYDYEDAVWIEGKIFDHDWYLDKQGTNVRLATDDNLRHYKIARPQDKSTGVFIQLK